MSQNLTLKIKKTHTIMTLKFKMVFNIGRFCALPCAILVTIDMTSAAKAKAGQG
jgi:hypothetical protein